jgi:hypothetical protein
MTKPAARRLEVGRALHEAGKLFLELEAPEHLRKRFGRGQYPSRALHRAMCEAEAAYAADDYDRCEHLVKVVRLMAGREIPRFKADPKRWIETREELRT